MVAATIFTGCKKFVDIDTPKTELLTSDAFTKDNSATSAVLGIYANMLNDRSFVNSGITIYGGLSADELLPQSQDPLLMQFQQNQLLPANSNVNSMWAGAYQNMTQINTCIIGLEASTKLTASIKTQLLGEAKFARAFTNFYLVNFWGNVPLVTTTSYTKNTTITQSKPADVYAAIIADLKEAQSLLNETYPTDGHARPNKWAATALLARVYLYTNDYANAEKEASAVIASGTYGPLPSLNDAFLKDSKEAIWQLLQNNNYSATNEGYTFQSSVPYGYVDYSLTKNLINSFETGDNRKTAWINSISYNSETFYYPFKYKDRGDYDAPVKETYIMLRLAEQYLIRAEARAQLDKTADAQADLNIIRERAGLSNFTGTGKTILLAAIATENRHEFMTEWGHRWLDLKRTGQADAVLSAQKTTMKPSSVLYPIPQTEINLNNKLIQNPGY